MEDRRNDAPQIKKIGGASYSVPILRHSAINRKVSHGSSTRETASVNECAVYHEQSTPAGRSRGAPGPAPPVPPAPGPLPAGLMLLWEPLPAGGRYQAKQSTGEPTPRDLGPHRTRPCSPTVRADLRSTPHAFPRGGRAGQAPHLADTQRARFDGGEAREGSFPVWKTLARRFRRERVLVGAWVGRARRHEGARLRGESPVIYRS